ncbi:MAG: glycosyltransferase [Candidatus Omnitrophica bacterium]|nr:glycosyltransferase [Candidatus Omnitrophota bacterium]MDD5591856.1 glycosyltransferase [Candidatus Omnitrophota bacterium]
MATKETPEFSVVIVAYNHAKYIAMAIESVLQQTYQDFEIIVLDDGSTDNIHEIVLSFPDSRVKYFYQENSGLPACARNKGISLSKGRYIALLDGDDFWHKDKLDKCRQILNDMPQVGLVCHNEAIIHGNKILRYTSYGPHVDQMYKKLLLDGNCLHTSAVVIRRSIFFDDALRFCEEKNLFTIEDYEYWLRLAMRFRFYFILDVLGYYRVTETGAFLRSTEVNALNMLSLLDSHFSKFGHQDKDLLERIRKRRSSVMCAAGRAFHHKNNFEESKEWYKKSICEYPFNYKAVIGYLAALLKLRIMYR